MTIKADSHEVIGKAWRLAWREVILFFAFPHELRHILYTTYAIKALNSKRRRADRARAHFPNDLAALKLLFLVLETGPRKSGKCPPVNGRRPSRSLRQVASTLGPAVATFS